MAGLTTSAYRRHLKAHGAGLVITEMVSAYGLIHGNRRTIEDYLRFDEEERPIAVQLFGDTPEVMAQAARLVLEGQPPSPGHPGRPVLPSAVPDMLDINMGCPVRKVIRTGAGSALLADPERAVAVAAAVVRVARGAWGAGDGQAAQRRAGRGEDGGRAGAALGGGRRGGSGGAPAGDEPVLPRERRSQRHGGGREGGRHPGDRLG